MNDRYEDFWPGPINPRDPEWRAAIEAAKAHRAEDQTVMREQEKGQSEDLKRNRDTLHR